jgi:alpha-ribazole phosphatase
MANCLVLVRHARLAAGHAGRLVGSTDLPLDALGHAQARGLAPGIRRWAPQRGYCSPMQRCRQTAQAIGADVPLEIDDDLREIDFGRWENRRFEELTAEDATLVDRWAAFEPDFVFPGGESLAAFLHRVHAVADRMACDPADTVLAVSHGGVIRAIICYLLGLEPRSYVLFDVAYASIVVLRLFDGKGVLVFSGADVPEEARHG